MVTIHPIRINSPFWLIGYALDKHTLYSIPLGHDEYDHMRFDTKRSEIGELLYKLKYNNDQTALPEIIETSCDFIKKMYLSEFKVDILFPVPPSKKDRDIQPVIQIAKGIGDILKIDVD